MAIHPAVQQARSQFEAYELHAARAGREVMRALASVVADSSSSSTDGLAAELEANAHALLDVMPLYAPPLNAMHQVLSRVEWARSTQEPVQALRTDIAQIAESYRNWSERARALTAAYARHVIPRGGTVYTFTLSETVLGTLKEAHKRGLRFKVLVTESRPNMDGRMTAKSLGELGLDVDIGVDAGLREMIPRADVMLVGAEAVLSDGSAVCKVGTYPSALVARAHAVPVYVLVDSLKFHPTSLFGHPLWLDPLQRVDVLPMASPGAAVRGHLFDTTPADLITGIITENGFLHASQVCLAMLGMPVSETLVTRLLSAQPRGQAGLRP